jgi:ubiquinone/menaquinone biosynthesis C-methylase UbiE
MTSVNRDELTTREVYDFSAEQYATVVGTSPSAAFEASIERAILDAFAEDQRASGDIRTLDVGCGVGRVTAYLGARGLQVSGVDLSSNMVAQARSAHPSHDFVVATMVALPFGDAEFDAAVYWYSMIHTPLAQLPAAWAEASRVLKLRGPMLVAFQAGENDSVTRENAYGSSATLTWYRHNVDDVVRSAEQAGFALRARTLRMPELVHETTPQAFLSFNSSAD